MNNSPYHLRGRWNGLLRPGARHLRQLWLNPAYRALHRFDRLLARLKRYTEAEVEFAGRSIHLCDGPSFLCAWDEIFVNRVFDLGPMEREPCLVDAGANIGLAALYWKLRYGRFRYLGFEPDPVVAEFCRRNLRTWGIEGELVQAAVGQTEGVRSFLSEGADSGRFVRDREEGAANVIQVSVQRLSRRLPEVVDLLKIDIEGAEAEVLEEIEPVLCRVKSLFVEWHGNANRSDLGVAITRLEKAGFVCFPQVAVGLSEPFMRSFAANRSSLNINLYAIRP